MTLKRFILSAACVVTVLGGAVTAAAATYSLAAGSGAQLHIGNGLALPVQTAVPPCVPPATNCRIFPPLKIGLAAVPVVINGTTNLNAGQRITVPPTALSKVGSQATVGVFFSNTALYAVATNLNFKWPAAAAVFSVGAGIRPSGSASVTLSNVGGVAGNNVRYSPREAGKRFGGAGAFALSAGPGSAGTGVTVGPVTIYGLTPSPPSPPPCTHTMLGGTPAQTGCVAALINAFPTGTGVIGGVAGATLMTPGTPIPNPGVGWGKFGPNPGPKSGQPAGTVSAFFPLPVPGPFNAAATSVGFPWTTAMLTLSASQATPPELFVLTGHDLRSLKGNGKLQMVSGSMSTRNVVQQNANRGWLRLDLVSNPPTPTMSPASLAATVGLMLLAGGYALRKRLFA
jgi:hypothetical protein